jgi:hypothetical protein
MNPSPFINGCQIEKHLKPASSKRVLAQTIKHGFHFRPIEPKCWYTIAVRLLGEHISNEFFFQKLDGGISRP